MMRFYSSSAPACEDGFDAIYFAPADAQPFYGDLYDVARLINIECPMKDVEAYAPARDARVSRAHFVRLLDAPRCRV